MEVLTAQQLIWVQCHGNQNKKTVDILKSCVIFDYCCK